MPVNHDFISPEQIIWANDNGCTITSGECGFGRPCVGLLQGANWVDYPYDFPYDKVPDLAYHKHDCVAVLVEGDDEAESWRQLSGWLDTIIADGWKVKSIDKVDPDIFSVLLGGFSTPILTK